MALSTALVTGKRPWRGVLPKVARMSSSTRKSLEACRGSFCYQWPSVSEPDQHALIKQPPCPPVHCAVHLACHEFLPAAQTTEHSTEDVKSGRQLCACACHLCVQTQLLTRNCTHSTKLRVKGGLATDFGTGSSNMFGGIRKRVSAPVWRKRS